MDFRILGPLEAWVGGQRLPLGGAKQRAVLAILLLEANRVVSTERLIELVWGEDPPETVANTLQVAISQLRKLLEPGHARGDPYRVLVSQEPGYMITVTPDELDLGQFEQLRAGAREAMSGGDPESAADQLRAALALWRGTPFSDLANETFVIAEANRLNDVRLQTLEDRIEADLALGRHRELVPELEEIVAEYPLRERFRAQLMLALYRSGRQAEASDIFHKTRTHLVEELGIEPGSELQRLLKAVLNQDPSLDLLTTPAAEMPRISNLPLQLTSFVGRSSAVTEIKRLLRQYRCVTLVGPGGVGKTRLAIETASQSLEDFADAVRLIELASLSDPSLLPQTLANSLGIRQRGGSGYLDAILHYVRRRELLLLIDNCEHLIQPVSQLVETILRSGVRLRVLATSREAFRIGAEAVYTVPPLSVPKEVLWDEIGELSDYEAIRLFCERASIDVTSLAGDTETSKAIVEICRRLDGVALAIELAAGTLSLLSARQIAARLDDRFQLLGSGERTALPRQQTLEASIDWSYELLPEEERLFLRRLSIFATDFSLEAAEAICGGYEIQRAQILGLLRNLVSKSLVNVLRLRDDIRYGLLETVREYALSRLAHAGEEAELRTDYLTWYLRLTDQALDGLHSAEQSAWLARLDREQPNLRKALSLGLAQKDETAPRLATSLTYFWLIRGQLSEGREWLRLVLPMAADPLMRARSLTGAGTLAFYQADYGACAELLAESARLHEGLNDRRDHALALTYWGVALLSLGDQNAGQARLEQAVQVGATAGETWELAMALNNLGFLLHLGGDMGTRPRTLLQRALTAARGADDAWHSEFILDSLAQVAVAHGDIPSARAHWLECMKIALRLEDRLTVPYVLEGFARVAFAESDYERSLRFLGAAASLFSEKGLSATPMEQDSTRLIRERSFAALDQADADSAWQQGSAMTVEEAVQYAVAGQTSNAESEAGSALLSG